MGIRDDEDEEETKEEAPEEEAADGSEVESPEDAEERLWKEGGARDSEEAAPEQAAPPINNTPLGAPATAVSPEERAKAIQDYLMAKYGEAADDSGIKAARESAGNTNLIANVGHAFETMGRANSMAHGGAGVDERFYQGLKNEGQQGVQQAMMDRQSKIGQFMQENALKQQVAQNMLARGTAEQKVQAQKWVQDFNEKKLQLSKEENALKYKTSADNTALKYKTLADNAAQRDLALSEGNKNRQAVKDQTDAIKTGQKNTKNYADLVDRAEGSRGAPQVVIKAMNAQTNIKNAQSLLDEYPDLNKMPDVQAKLLFGELEKIATNGAGSEAGRHGLDPDTFQQNLNKLKSRWWGEPSGAEIGAFLQQNQSYLHGLGQVSNGVVNTYRQHLLTGRKGQLNPDDVEEYKNTYADAFPKVAQPDAVAPPKGPTYEPGMAVGAPAGASVGPSKSDLEAEMKRRGLLK